MVRKMFSALGKKVRALAAVGTVLVAGACSETTGPQLSRVRLELTDAPSGVIAKAEGWLFQVYFQGGGDVTEQLSNGGR